MLPTKYHTALSACIQASDAIMEVYGTDFQAILKNDDSPVTEADFASSRIIRKALEPFNIPILGEEGEIPEFEERRNWKEYWCIDPLDGTRMFLERNDEFCINIAYIVDNKPVFGIIASPTERKIIFGGPILGVYQCSFEQVDKSNSWEKIESLKGINNPLRVICSRSYKHGSGYKYTKLLDKQFGELIYIRKGSALKFFNLADGSADVYMRFAPTMEWDIAAGHAILKALGGSIVQVDNNKELKYNKRDLYNPFFIAKTKGFLSV